MEGASARRAASFWAYTSSGAPSWSSLPRLGVCVAAGTTWSRWNGIRVGQDFGKAPRRRTSSINSVNLMSLPRRGEGISDLLQSLDKGGSPGDVCHVLGPREQRSLTPTFCLLSLNWIPSLQSSSMDPSVVDISGEVHEGEVEPPWCVSQLRPEVHIGIQVPVDVHVQAEEFGPLPSGRGCGAANPGAPPTPRCTSG